jgi:hypothetical protein
MAATTPHTNVEHINHNANNSRRVDVEKTTTDGLNHSNSQARAPPSYKQTTRPFIGRLGGNQEFVLDRHNAANAEILREQPDSAPCMTLREQFDLQGFRSLGLWKVAVLEGFGTYSPLELQSRPGTNNLSSRCNDARLHHNLDQHVPRCDSRPPNRTTRPLR